MNSLYLHIPFCKSKCFYCSFSSFGKKDELIDLYLDALKKEAALYKGARVDTVYIGGGTPTYLSQDQLKFLFDCIHSSFNLALDAEVTIEANPSTFDLEKGKLLFSFGISRVSLGVQSLDDKILEYLGRPHDSAQAQEAFMVLRRAGFRNINVDLIYSLPAQTLGEIENDVDKLAALGSEHISLYTLSIEEGSEFHRRNIEAVKPEKQGEHYVKVAGWLKDKGFEHYEVSNFSKPGYACRHNQNYWQGGNYIGLGASAHSHQDGARFWNVGDPQEYISCIRKAGSAKAGEERLDTTARFLESLLIGLRCLRGVNVENLKKKFGVSLSSEQEEAIEEMVKHGLLQREGDSLKATLNGIVVLDEISGRLI